MEVVLWVLIGLALLIGPLVMSIIALVRQSGFSRDMNALRAEIALLHNAVAAGAGGAPAAAAAAAAPAIEPVDLKDLIGDIPERFRDEPAAEAAATVPQPSPAQPEAEPTAPEAAPLGEGAAPETPPPATPAPPGRGLGGWIEEELTSRWLVWLGGLALALSGYFLIRYAAEQGFFGPGARVTGGLLLGLALAAAGEWVRRRPSQRRIAAVRADYVPQALTAAGLFALFAAMYAAHAFYGLIGPGLAFIGLAAVALASFALSVLHGPFVAILGLLAGFVTPALIPSEKPFAEGLFGYLLVIVAACAAVMYFRPWWWLGFGAILGAALWTLIWLVVGMQPGDEMVIGAFLILTAGVFIGFAGLRDNSADPPVWQGIPPERRLDVVAWAGAVAGALLLLLTVSASGFTHAGVVMVAAAAVGFFVAATRYERFDGMVFLAAVMVVALAAMWAERAELMVATQEWGQVGQGLWAEPTPEDVYVLMRWAATFAAAFAAAGYWLLWRARRPAVLAGVSVLAPIVLLLVVYARLRGVEPDGTWAIASLVIAGAALAATSTLIRHEADERLVLPLGLYAVAVVAGISLALAFVLREAWLTVALALELPAIAWISNRLKLDLLRKVAAVVAAIVIVRLALNPAVLGYHETSPLGSHWVIYGYGVPLIAFHVAFELFRQRRDDYVTKLMESGRIIFLTLLISSELRILIAGSISTPSLGLLEASLQAITWLTVGWTRWRAYGAHGRIIDWWGAVILTVLGVGCVVAVNLLVENPVFTGEDIGRWPLVNTLALAYLAPAILVWLIARDAPLKWSTGARFAVSAFILLLVFVYLTLETKHIFQGPTLIPETTSETEYYAYSVVWLVFAFVLLGAGLLLRRADLRYAALAVLVIAVLKVFLSDMAGLEGLLRVASFLGLGLSLVGIGFLYQRFVFAVGGPPPAAGSPSEAPPPAEPPGPGTAAGEEPAPQGQGGG